MAQSVQAVRTQGPLSCIVITLKTEAVHSPSFPKPRLVALNMSGTVSNATNPLCNISAFAKVLPDYARVERVDWVTNGSTYGEGAANLGYPTQPTDLPALCAVTVNVTSSPVSSYRFGVFLPEQWNSRYLFNGNGGFAGGINWLDMSQGVHYGFASVSTDTGHNSSVYEMSWALNNPEARTDWGWRSVHGSVELSKPLVEAYYADKVDYSYYMGCSTGGRQGMREMQLDPESFDGVIAGAPSWWLPRIDSWLGVFTQYNWPAEDPKHIPWTLLQPLADEVMKHCDGIDGVEDSIISNPELCHINYTALLCSSPNANTSSCLTEPQLETLKKLYADYITSSGELIYPGQVPGTESQFFNQLNYSDGNPYALGYARYFFLNDPDWTIDQFNDSLALAAARLDAGSANADQYDLSAFRDTGGKFVLFQGMSDGVVPQKGSNLYYNRVVEAMGAANGTTTAATATHDFLRYFPIPGMLHCSSSEVGAPWAIGGPQGTALGNNTFSVPGFEDPQHDILLALMDWVEKGTPIDSIVATAWRDDADVSSGVLRQRPICPYPQTAKWDGAGDVDQAESWSCS